MEGFNTFWAPENKPDATPGWQRMRKGVADLHHKAEVWQAANDRYLAPRTMTCSHDGQTASVRYCSSDVTSTR